MIASNGHINAIIDLEGTEENDIGFYPLGKDLDGISLYILNDENKNQDKSVRRANDLKFRRAFLKALEESLKTQFPGFHRHDIEYWAMYDICVGVVHEYGNSPNMRLELQKECFSRPLYLPEKERGTLGLLGEVFWSPAIKLVESGAAVTCIHG